MTTREYLAAIAYRHLEAGGDDPAGAIADAILAAGFKHPQDVAVVTVRHDRAIATKDRVIERLTKLLNETERAAAQDVETAKREAVREYIETKEMPVVRIETKPEWERIAAEVRAAALAEQREGIAAAIHDYADAAWDLIDSPNGARLAFENVDHLIRTFTKGDGE